MPITHDMDSALHEAKVSAKTPKLWRMGPAAIAALVAERSRGHTNIRDLPTRYREIPIERVDAPPLGLPTSVSSRAFHGWELVV